MSSYTPGTSGARRSEGRLRAGSPISPSAEAPSKLGEALERHLEDEHTMGDPVADRHNLIDNEAVTTKRNETDDPSKD
jgi:hypothetical protein